MDDTQAPTVSSEPATAGSRHPFSAGALVAGRFRIVREVAEGAMGVVYEAIDEKLNQRRALKCAKPGFAGRLPPEARHSLRVTHPNVCRVFEIHTADSPFGVVDFLSMEYVDGGTLAAVLARRGALPEPEARAIALQICAGVDAAHAQQVLHRDLKSSNVLLTTDASDRTRAVVTDFGLAQEHGAAASSLDPVMVSGTPSYLAPERWRGQPATVAADVYALGVVLHELIAGRQPETTGLREKILAPNLPKRWKAVIARCLDADPSKRYASAGAVADALVDRAGTIRRFTAWAAAVLVPILYVTWQVMFPAPVAARLAILPLEAQGGDAGTAALVQGVSADLSGRLRRRRPRPPQLVVIPVEETAGLDAADPASAKDRVGASHILRATVARSGGGIVVRAEIVDTSTRVPVREWRAQFSATDGDAIVNGLVGLVASTFKLPRQRDAEVVAPVAYSAYVEGTAALNGGAASFAAAVAALDRAAALDPNSVLPRTALVEAYYLQWLRTADDTWLARGRTALEGAATLNPDSLAVRLAAGRLNLVPGRYALAAQEYVRATELDADSPEAWLGLARAYQELSGRDAEAVAAFMKAIELQPGYYAPVADLGSFYFRRGDHAEAERFWTRAVALAPKLRAVHTNLGVLYVGTGRYAEGERELRRALEIEPNARIALNNLGALYQYLGRDADAVPMFERARSSGPDTPALLLNLGDSYRRLGMPAAAVKAYARGRELAEALLLRNPADAVARVFTAHFALRMGDVSAGRRELAQALNLDEGNVAVIERAAFCYEVMGDRAGALAVLGSAPAGLLTTLSRHPDLKDLARDPRFVAMAAESSQRKE